MCNICARFEHRLYFFSQCAIYAQDLHKIVLLSQMCNICARLYFFFQCPINVQDLLKIVLLSPMCNLCGRFAEDCTSFSNVQYMHRFVQDCTSFSSAEGMHKIWIRLSLFPQCRIYVEDFWKIVLISTMHDICARFSQDCTYFPNTQYMHKICTRLYFFLQCAI